METLSAMLPDGTAAFLQLHAAWASPILFIVMIMEGIVLTTFIFSGTVMILAAGAMIQSGILGYMEVFAAVCIGICVGDWINFEMGRRGETWFRNLGVVKKRPQMMEKAEVFLKNYGIAAIFFSRFMGPSRPFVTFLAGTCRMSPTAFHLATLIGALLLTAGLLNAGMTGIQLWGSAR
jgi:membrane protein DedA with SNARE-associated domain